MSESQEVSVRPEQGVAVQERQAHSLIEWAQAAQAAHDLAMPLVQTTFVPEAVRGNAGAATAQILMGTELGLSPMTSLRSIYIVHGTPAMYARTMLALVQSQGHEVWTETSSDTSVTVAGRRRGSEHVEKSTWTLNRAQKAGYTSNKKYVSNPQEMLYAKAVAEVCRHIAADVLSAIPYTVEDIELAEPETVTVTRTESKPKRVIHRKKEPEPVEPDIPEDPETSAAPEPLVVEEATDGAE